MKPEFIDTHAHLDFPDFADELPAVVERAKSAGVNKIITIGTTLESSRRAITIAEQFPNVFAAVGWHPSYVTSAPETIVDELRTLARHPKVVAIGEAGLDFSRLPSGAGGTAEEDERYKSRQRQLFEDQLQLASELGLNIIIHQRDAFTEVISQLAPYAKKLRAVFHCFVGTPEERDQVTALGSMVSFTGIVTFKNAATVRETVRSTAPDQFMLETDCPFLAPVPYRGKRCEPAHTADTAAFIAKEKNCTIEELSAATCRTAREFFGKLS